MCFLSSVTTETRGSSSSDQEGRVHSWVACVDINPYLATYQQYLSLYKTKACLSCLNLPKGMV